MFNLTARIMVGVKCNKFQRELAARDYYLFEKRGEPFFFFRKFKSNFYE